MEFEHESINGRSSENVVSIKDMKQIENEEEQLQYNVLDRPPFLLIISLALQVRKCLIFSHRKFDGFVCKCSFYGFIISFTL